MNFGFNDEQSEIKSTANGFAQNRFKSEAVREQVEKGGFDEGIWKELSELGWAGIAISEEHGGQGLGMVELAILLEELGYVVAPTPFLANACAGLALEWAGSDEQKSSHLEGIATGEARGAIGSPEVFIDAEGAATPVIVDERGARILDPASAGFEELELIDETRGYSKPSSTDGDALAGEIAAATDRIAVAVAAELVGIGQRAMDMAVAYAKERHQFDRPIGAYQAVSHACAQMLYDVEEARSLTYYAAWAADAEPESLPLAAAMAKARAGDAAWSVTKASIQVHGGIGFTWEHDLHFLLKRARADAQLFGTAAQHRERVADLAGMA
jgi:alkylation response protein AidB-like acyl-CoA dehydrogenase